MHEAVHIVDPVLKLLPVVLVGLVVWLRGSSAESVRGMALSRDVHEVEVEHLDRDDPAIHHRRWRDVRVREHVLDRGRVRLDDELAHAYQVEAERAKRAEKTVEFEFRLRESRFTIVQGDGTEPAVVALPRVVLVLLT